MQHDASFIDDSRMLFPEHYYSHAARARFSFPFEREVVLTLDGVGESTTTTMAIGRVKDLDPDAQSGERIQYSVSLYDGWRGT